MYSTGTEQQNRCLDEDEEGAAGSNRAGLFKALGSVVISLVAISLMLSVD